MIKYLIPSYSRLVVFCSYILTSVSAFPASPRMPSSYMCYVFYISNTQKRKEQKKILTKLIATMIGFKKHINSLKKEVSHGFRLFQACRIWFQVNGNTPYLMKGLVIGFVGIRKSRSWYPKIMAITER